MLSTRDLEHRGGCTPRCHPSQEVGLGSREERCRVDGRTATLVLAGQPRQSQIRTAAGHSCVSRGRSQWPLTRVTLFVCHIDDDGPPSHACRRALRRRVTNLTRSSPVAASRSVSSRPAATKTQKDERPGEIVCFAVRERIDDQRQQQHHCLGPNSFSHRGRSG